MSDDQTTPTLVEEYPEVVPEPEVESVPPQESLPTTKEELDEYIKKLPPPKPRTDGLFLPDVVMPFINKGHRIEEYYHCEAHDLPIIYKAICPETFKVESYHRMGPEIKVDDHHISFLACRCDLLDNPITLEAVRDLFAKSEPPTQ